MSTIERDGVSIFYEARGDGPAILLSHGYGATSQMWARQLELLARDHRLIVWDMRGHGQTDSPEDPSCYSEAETVDDMAAILDAEGVESAVIGGLSLGGYMSLAFNVAYPERDAGADAVRHGTGLQQSEGSRGLEHGDGDSSGGGAGARRSRRAGRLGGGAGLNAPLGRLV